MAKAPEKAATAPARRPPFLAEPPAYRRLRVYAFDPSLDTELDTALINQTVVRVPWEAYRDTDPRGEARGVPGRLIGLRPGPIGEYLEVVDFDPASGRFYDPIDLNDPRVLAQDGLPPSEGSPQFHQQMAYAVAMTTIGHFERALGRKALWSPRPQEGGDEEKAPPFVRRLRVYPHALREPNAYYSPDKKALLFGYFPASRERPGRNLPDGVVFTCLSHDIIAHETTHALLDGLNRYFLESTNPDVPAFHEAFADLVALFQHFTFPEALRHQIARTRGDLTRQSLLGELAQQFGQGIGQYGALRSAIGGLNDRGEWEPSRPDPERIRACQEPHDRGAILVAAVFQAFLTVYRARIGDLLRIATGGTGVLPTGEIHPDLVGRLADEAAATADHMLMMCVRALDYCPAIDITFGEYLRAMITADLDITPDDRRGYRVAMIEAFRRWGIYPEGVRTLSVDSLKWQGPSAAVDENFVTTLIEETLGDPGRRRRQDMGWGLSGDRRGIYYAAWGMCRRLRQALMTRPIPPAVQRYLGLALDVDAPASIERDAAGRPLLEVHSVRPARRTGQRGEPITDLVVVLIQRRRGYRDPAVQAAVDAGRLSLEKAGDAYFTMRGGCTLLIDLERRRIRYAIYKPIFEESRLARQREFEAQPLTAALAETYFGHEHDQKGEPFARLHRG